MIQRYTLPVLFTFLISVSLGQSRTAVQRSSEGRAKSAPYSAIERPVSGGNNSGPIHSQKGGTLDPGTIDTLNYPLEGEYSLYVYDGGFISGTNNYHDRAKANIFSYGTPTRLTGVLIDFAVASSSDLNIEIAAWDNKGSGGLPGNKIASTTIPLDDIFIDVLNNQTTYIAFDETAVMTPNFYVGVVLPSGGDTLALYTNTDGDTDPAEAWELWENYEWHRYDDNQSWNLKIAHAIFPVVDNSLLSFFSASPKAVQPGGDVTFFDSSVGNPLSWEWHFEGGTPATSALKNPVVTYSQEGEYDVTLIVGNGSSSDTLTREDYILVTEEIPVQTDTLNYPLDGTYAVYIIVENNVWGGYVCGTNYYGDLAKANYFSIGEEFRITGLLVDFAIASGGNPGIELAVWNNDGATGGPGTKLAGKMVELNTIESDIANNMLTFVSFDNPVNLNHSFYAGFVLPTAATDTLVVWSNENGDTSPGIAWDKWEDGNWVAIADPMSYNMNIAMGIHPIIEYQTGIADAQRELRIPVFPNPSNGKILVDLGVHPSPARLDILDLQGRTVTGLEIRPGMEKVELDISENPSGIYLLRLTGDGYTATEKIILH